MADEPVAQASAPPATTWAGVAQTALHYAAAGVLLGGIGYLATIDPSYRPTFGALCVAALTGLGVYQGRK